MTESAAAGYKNLADGPHGIHLHPGLLFRNGVGNCGKVDLPRLQLTQRLRRGAVGHVNIDAGIGFVKGLQMLQQEKLQRQIRSADADPALFQAGDLAHILLAAGQFTDARLYKLKQCAALCRQGDTLGAADQQAALQLLLQLPDALAHRRLGNIQFLRGTGNAAATGHVIKYPIPFQIHCHNDPLFSQGVCYWFLL